MNNSKKYILGADPGKHGGVVLLSASYNPLHIAPDDILMFPVKKTEEGDLDIMDIWNTIAPYRDQILLYVQEDVHALFGSSANGTFEFGAAVGALYATLQLLSATSNLNSKAEVVRVAPKVWQKLVWKPSYVVIDKKKSTAGRKKTDTKATSTNAAAVLFPGVSFTPKRCRTVHDGLVDAALIAYYGLRKEFCELTISL